MGLKGVVGGNENCFPCKPLPFPDAPFGPYGDLFHHPAAAGLY